MSPDCIAGSSVQVIYIKASVWDVPVMTSLSVIK